MFLSDFYRDTLHVTDPDLLEQVVALSEIRLYRQGGILIQQGEVPTYVFFLMHGTLRGVLLDINGRDITDCIVYHSGDAAMPDNDLTQPASVTMEALTDCTLACIPVEEAFRLIREQPAVAELYQQLVLRAAGMHRALKIAICQYSAAQRYQWFLEAYPGLIHRISHKYIASLLNMTPVTFSKIRKSLKESERV